MSKKTLKGFTIVELLIVIVVMGILATIVIVTYQGVQDKANTQKNQQYAREVREKATAYNSLKTEYPASKTVFSDTNVDVTVKLTSETQAALDKGDPSDTNREGLKYENCGTPATGAKVSYWSYEKKQVVAETVGEGC